MECVAVNEAMRRYQRRFMSAMAVYVVLIFGSVFWLKHEHPGLVLSYALAFLPSVPLVASLAIVARYLKEERDEFQRAVLLESMLWALAAVLAVSTVWGLLEMLDQVPRLPVFYIYPGFWGLAGMANPMVRRRYRGGEGQ